MSDNGRPPAVATVREVRVKCGGCGAHVIAWQGHALTGECGNCGSYEMRPLPRPPGYDRDRGSR